MTVKILLFASAADIVGGRSLSVDVPAEATVADVQRAVRLVCPQLAGLLEVSRWAVDQQFVPSTASVPADGEIALIPPVSGG